MAGRNNILINWLNISFDTFNLLHRWFGRIVVLEAVAHTVAWMLATHAKGGWAAIQAAITGTPFITYGFIVGRLFNRVRSVTDYLGNYCLRCNFDSSKLNLPTRLLRKLQVSSHRPCHPQHRRSMVSSKASRGSTTPSPLRSGRYLGRRACYATHQTGMEKRNRLQSPRRGPPRQRRPSHCRHASTMDLQGRPTRIHIHAIRGIVHFTSILGCVV